MGSLGLFFLLLLAGPDRLAAQGCVPGLFPGSADSGGPAPAEIASLRRPFSVDRLLPEESHDDEPSMASADLEKDAPLRLGLGGPWRPAETPLTTADGRWLPATEPASGTQPCPTRRLMWAHFAESERRLAFADPTVDAPPQLEQAESDLPRWEFLERHRLLITTLVPIAGLGVVTVNSLYGYEHQGFQVSHEGWFGPDTANGGADKASHLADYFVVASLFADAYRILGYSENASLLWGFGLALATGLGNEVSDGFTRHGFSWEDLAMDAAGATAASVLSKTRTRDLSGIRTSHVPGPTYTHDVFSADFKISGLGKRLGVNLGPLRWLLLSVTYGSKGYRVDPPIELQRQVGFEVGLNLEQILNDLGVKRNTWWGYTLHAFGDYVRFPFTAVGMRVDLNHGRWHGPNNGNYD